MRTLALTLVAILALAAPVQGQPSGDPGQAVNQTVEDTESLLDKTLDGVGDAAGQVGDAAEATGDGVGKGAGAIGRALAAAAKAVGKMAAATGEAIGAAAVAVGHAAVAASKGLARLTVNAGSGLASVGLVSALGLSGAVLAAGSAAGSGLTLLGASASSGLAFAGVAVAAASQAVGAVLREASLAYVGLIGNLRPDAVPVAVFGTVAVTGAAASTGVGGWAGWAALKKWGWMGSAGIAGFSRIADDELLEHPLRTQIFQVIQSNPGIHASGLARQVGVGWGTITHHLEKLEKGHLVATRKINNQKCFFENGGRVSRHDMAVAGAVKGDTASDISAYVLGHPMTSQKDMATSLGLSPALVSFHVKKLVNLGVLDKVRHGKETLLTTSEALRRVLAAEKSPAVHLEQKDESFSYTS